MDRAASSDAGHLLHAHSCPAKGAYPEPQAVCEPAEKESPAVASPPADSDDASTVGDGAEHTPTRAKSEIDICRRVVPLIEVSDDCCPICLDEYTAADPGVPTICGHSYHLQCVMQWAQRSRECPLCFHSLLLQDEEMNQLLPFGEWVSPDAAAMSLVDVESWELERLLLRLNASGSSRHHHHHRSHGERRRASTSGGGQRSSGVGAPARVEASTPQPIAGRSRRTDPGDAADQASTLEAYPSSWPPSEVPRSSSRSGGGIGVLFGGGRATPPSASTTAGEDDASLRGRASSLKSKFASLRLKTARELKHLFGPGGGSSSSGRGGEDDSSSSALAR